MRFSSTVAKSILSSEQFFINNDLPTELMLGYIDAMVWVPMYFEEVCD